ncbi:MAG: ABC transporter ATP-binding protein, partial [Methyloceanibacter sp.]
MLEFLKSRAANAVGKTARGDSGRGKAAVSFAARLTFADVSRRYGETLALDHVDLDIAPSEVLCLLGPSG